MKVEIISEDRNECMVCKDWQGFFFDVRLESRGNNTFRWQYIFGKPDGITDDMVTEAVKAWNIKKELTPKTSKTFNVLIDEL